MASLVERFAREAGGAGIFLDFDGTLSEIVHVPSDARPVEGAAEVLSDLATRYRLVSIVSGRSAHQLLDWLGPEIEIWGVHGAERTVDGAVELIDAARDFVELMGRVKEEAAARIQQADLAGVVLEDKGVMLGLHFRAAEDGERATRELDAIAQELADRHGLKRAGGRLAYELRPPRDFTKAAVVLERARDCGLGAAAFVGDDKVDLPAFDALDALAEEGLLTMRVAVDSPEAPPELIERADVVVEGPDAAVTLLRSLLETSSP